MIVRRAVARDRDALVGLAGTMGGHDDVASRAHPFSTLDAQLDAPNVRVLVACDARETVVGFASIRTQWSAFEDRREAVLAALAVAERERGHGIGRALLDAVDATARELGCAVVVLTSRVTRTRAHDFYRANGFDERPPALRFERAIAANAGTLVDRFLAAAGRAATGVSVAIAGRRGGGSVGIGADGAPTELADAAAERAAFAEFVPLGVPIVSEEAGLVGARSVDPDEAWISLDPLDGSRNYVLGYPSYAMSAALVLAGRPLAGLVADLVSGRRYVARKDGGATLDGVALQTRRSPLAALPSPMPGETFPPLPSIGRLRISGSMALDFCRVGDGSLGAFYGLARPVAHAHDIAAAILVIEEAGGVVIDATGAPPVLEPDPRRQYGVVAAADEALARELAGLTRRVG